METSVVYTMIVIIGSFYHGICSQKFPDINGYYMWNASFTRNDLYCPELCKARPYYEELECCACYSGQCWDIIDPEKCGVTISSLHIEYIDIQGTNKVITIPEESNSTFYRLMHQNGRLTAMPENLCDFPNTVSVNLANNFVAVLENISCITELNTLYLNRNNLKGLDSNTFSTLHKLRTLDISYNKIVTLEPNVFDTGNNVVFHVNAIQETPVRVDITNIYSQGFFCIRNFSNGQVEIVNENNFTLDGEPSIIGPGDVYTGPSKYLPFYNFTDIGVSFPDLRRKLKISHYSNVYGFYCDCSIVPFLNQAALEEFAQFWPNYVNATCSGPEAVSGIVLIHNLNDEMLDKLVCNVIENCPWRCICTDHQNQGKVVVNCSGAGYTALPDYMPTGYWNNRQLDVLLDHNDIGNAELRDWLSRTKKMSLSRNPLERIEAAVVKSLPNDAELDLSGLKLTEMPEILQKKDLHKINFTDTSIVCDCTNTWIGEWIRSNLAFKKLSCIVHGTNRFAEYVSADTLDCFKEDSLNTYLLSGILVLVTILLTVPITLLHYFRFEILILKRRLFYKRKTQSKLFISFDVEDDWVFHWVIRDRERKHFHETVLEELAYRNIAFFIPYLDMMLGGNVEEETSRMASKCTTFLIILSKGYLQNDLCRQEFDIIWTQYKENTDKNIIVIMFDSQNKLGENIDRRIRALLRADRPLRFEAGTISVLDRLLVNLENPRQLPIQMKSCVDGTERGCAADMKFKPKGMLHLTAPSSGTQSDTCRNMQLEDIEETFCLKAQAFTNNRFQVENNRDSLSTDFSNNEHNQTRQVLAQEVQVDGFKEGDKTTELTGNATCEKILCLSEDKMPSLKGKTSCFNKVNDKGKFKCSPSVSGSPSSVQHCLSSGDKSSESDQQQCTGNIFRHQIKTELPSKREESVVPETHARCNKFQFRIQPFWFDSVRNMSIKHKHVKNETASNRSGDDFLGHLRNRTDRLSKRSLTPINP